MNCGGLAELYSRPASRTCIDFLGTHGGKSLSFQCLRFGPTGGFVRAVAVLVRDDEIDIATESHGSVACQAFDGGDVVASWPSRRRQIYRWVRRARGRLEPLEHTDTGRVTRSGLVLKPRLLAATCGFCAGP